MENGQQIETAEPSDTIEVTPAEVIEALMEMGAVKDREIATLRAALRKAVQLRSS